MNDPCSLRAVQGLPHEEKLKFLFENRLCPNLLEEYDKDRSDLKINFSTGDYRDPTGRVVLLKAVKEAEVNVKAAQATDDSQPPDHLSKAYGATTPAGVELYANLTFEMIFGKNNPSVMERSASM